MSKENYQLDNQILKKKWEDINQTNQEYITIEKVEKWVRNVVQKMNPLQFSLEGRDVNQLLVCYLVECQLEGQLAQVQFKYQQAVNFFNWLAVRLQQQNGQMQEQGKPQNEEIPIKHLLQHKQQQKQLQFNQSHHSHKQQQKHQSSLDKEQIENNNSQIKRNEVQYQQQQQYDGNVEKDQQQQYQQMNTPKSDNNQKSQKQHSNSIEILRKQQNIKPNVEVWKEHLQVIFQHYCRISFAYKQDPTFQQIQKQSQSMTVNKFMIFCRDFGIAELSNIKRSFLVDLFKKNAQLSKSMTLKQFQIVINKISKIFNEKQDQNNSEQSLTKFLQFLQIQTSQQFNSKTKKMNINYIKKALLPAKKMPVNYQFKFIPNDKPILTANVSENGLKKLNQLKKPQTVERQPTNSIKSHKIMKSPIKIHKEDTTYHKKLQHPPIPKINYNSSKSSYYDIHILKNKPTQHNKLRLNSVLQDAKRIVQEQEHQLQYNQINKKRKNSYHLNNISSSQRNYQINPIEDQIEQYHRYNKPQKRLPSQQFQQLLQQQEQDQFLLEHLNREKKNGQINKRIQKKIQQLQI